MYMERFMLSEMNQKERGIEYRLICLPQRQDDSWQGGRVIAFLLWNVHWWKDECEIIDFLEPNCPNLMVYLTVSRDIYISQQSAVWVKVFVQIFTL